MNRLPSVKQLQYLLALHAHQHFGRAASACFISQSTLSAAIANLEEVLGSQLLERDHKTFLFTPFGEQVVKLSQRVITELDAIAEYAENQRDPMSGVVRLGCIPTIAPFVLSEIMAQVRIDYPNLHLLLREDTTDNLLAALAAGQIDLLLLALPYPTNLFHIETLAQDDFKLILHKDWRARGFEQDISTWPDESIFLLEREHCLTNHALQGCDLKDNKKINPFFATSLHTLTEMVNSKLGVTFLPQLAINSGILAGTNLVAQKPAAKHAYREIGLAWRRTSQREQCFNLLSKLIKDILLIKCKA